MSLPTTIRDKRDYRTFLQADLRAHGLTSWNILDSIRHPAIRVQRRIRRVEYLMTRRGLTARLRLSFAKLLLLRASESTGVQIPPGVAGPGLAVAHYGSVVVNSRVRIGKYCRIHSATNIGAGGGGVPTIGDYVYIGPGAVIYGAISIGDAAVIGANAVVNKNVPPGVTVAGAPARVITRRGSAAIMPSWIQVPLDGSDEGGDPQGKR